MKVGILAGGLGSRLAEETVIKPKPMIEIGGRPILWHIMMHYSTYGFKDFVVALGYKGEYIKRYMADYCSLASDLRVSLKTGDVKPHTNGNGNAREDWEVDLIDTGQPTNTGGRIKHQCFLLPMDDRTTHVFFIFYFDAIQIPLLRRPMPRRLQHLLMLAARHLLIRPLLAQDGRMVEAEQQAYERDPRIAGYELNPAVGEFQKLIVGKWREHLGRDDPAASAATPAEVASETA